MNRLLRYLEWIMSFFAFDAFLFPIRSEHDDYQAFHADPSRAGTILGILGLLCFKIALLRIAEISMRMENTGNSGIQRKQNNTNDKKKFQFNCPLAPGRCPGDVGDDQYLSAPMPECWVRL
ncbi:hypothetical protein PoB_001096300 [Plakobranchus ocellatus]|uniref:Uncharacterized protein n=1 Tax=Plakobranchus ocellatus TaxID=259542 RepID=A0AAV3YQC1_9GAST|nr:hypothetical protein PoB_001096300 [Plakobranchus ocellatus]